MKKHILILLIGMILLIIGIASFTAMHNVDNVLNGLLFSYNNNLDFYSHKDCNSFTCYNLLTMYMFSMEMMRICLITLFAVIIFLISYIVKLKDEVNEYG